MKYENGKLNEIGKLQEQKHQNILAVLYITNSISVFLEQLTVNQLIK